MNKRAALAKVLKVIEKRQANQCLGKCFTIILEEPCQDSSYQGAPTIEITHYKTKGYQIPQGDNINDHPQSTTPQTEETPNEPTT